MQQIERSSSLKINSNMPQMVGKRDSRLLETMSNSELGTINNLESAKNNLEIMSDDLETGESSDLNIDDTQDDVGSACKKTRGRTRLQLLHLQKEPIQVELNVLRQPIGEFGHKLGQYIGFIVSDSAIAPLTFEDLRYMPKETKIHVTCMRNWPHTSTGRHVSKPSSPLEIMAENQVDRLTDPEQPRTLRDFMNPTRMGAPSCSVYPPAASHFHFRPISFKFYQTSMA
ncbi:hypothetical protein LWI28_013605 [Acer negundo]|uniref:Uncharacterized protein n=1 Tax=Acer negundo TaxID=4023 RepID=A0AAD5ILP2_ACENE|nr:hypothetical protein LWI28_013605 [Acer negundo]